MIDRTLQPVAEKIQKISIIKAEESTLDNGLKLYSIRAGEQAIAKISFVFEAGFWYQSQSYLASTVNAMLKEGTSELSSAEIATKLDYYGAFLQTSTERDVAFVTLYTLTKFLDKTLSIIFKLFTDATIPESELATYIRTKKQYLMIEETKVKTIAKKRFDNVLYGNNHPYGAISNPDEVDALNRNTLIDFYNSNYKGKSFIIIAAGNLPADFEKKINSYFGKMEVRSTVLKDSSSFKIQSAKEMQHVFEVKDALQSAIRLGKITIGRTDPEYPELKTLNTIFGGYFGSRLMKNIREDKGYTYGINSLVFSMRHSAYISVVSEVNSSVSRNTIEEIYKEMRLLRTVPVSEDELDRVKNYILGELIRMFDGPFALSDAFWTLKENNLSYDYFDRFIKSVKEITSERILALADKYLQEDTFYEVIAGKY